MAHIRVGIANRSVKVSCTSSLGPCVLHFWQSSRRKGTALADCGVGESGFWTYDNDKYKGNEKAKNIMLFVEGGEETTTYL